MMLSVIGMPCRGRPWGETWLWPFSPLLTTAWRGWNASGGEWKLLRNGTRRSIIFRDKVSVTVACSVSNPKARSREICVLIWDLERLRIPPLTVWGEETISRVRDTAGPSSAAAAGFFRFTDGRVETKCNDNDLSGCKWDPFSPSSCNSLIPGFMPGLQCNSIDSVLVVGQDTIYTHTHRHTLHKWGHTCESLHNSTEMWAEELKPWLCLTAFKAPPAPWGSGAVMRPVSWPSCLS